MCTKAQCEPYIGKWIEFRTPWGWHRGVIERVTNNTAVIVSPSRYVPAQFAIADAALTPQRDVALAWGMGGAPGTPGAGYGGYPGGVGGYPGGGFGWYGGWTRWAVSFLIIYVLWGLLLW